MAELHDATQLPVLMVNCSFRNLPCCEPLDEYRYWTDALSEGVTDVNFLWGYSTNIHIHFEVVPETYENCICMSVYKTSFFIIFPSEHCAGAHILRAVIPQPLETYSYFPL